ncbi:MAG: S8 family serine peptidase, partial [Elusimicrobia bacterium]|nr:S8 family serine peptidase [Elusimicrobiota bacterium]
TVNGTPEPISAIKSKITSGEIPEAEKTNLEAAEKASERFGKKLQLISQVNKQEHRQVHQRMEAIVRAAVMHKIEERLTVGRELEGWGVPNKISVDLGAPTGLRYSNLYRMNGMPTDLGVALHKILSPLVARDPAALSRITQGQLHEAIRLLAESRKYVMDPSSEDFQKLRRMGLISEGYAYPEWRGAFMNKAKAALEAEPEAGDRPFGLGVRPESKHPSDVLRNLLKQTVERYNAAIGAGVSRDEISGLRGLIGALSGATGLPVDLGAGPMTPGVQHRQLLPILEELQKIQAEEEVVKAVVRSFPLGESLYRLGVHGLWAKGLTGRGIKVAVIDNGVDFEHPDLSGVKSHSENLTRDRGWFTKGAHGTPMADIIHAIAPDAEIQSYQALSNAQLPGVRLSENETYDAVLKAMDRAKANGAQIISLSLGFPMGLANDPLTQKVAEFAKDGILVVVSAGNDGFDMPGNFQLRTPGTAPDAITVGAADYHGNKAYFSSAGQAMNPDDYSLQDKPDIYAFGVNIKAAARLPKEVYAQEAVPYTDVSGTSPAAPHVAGLAALMVQAAQGSGVETANARAVPAAKQALRAAARMVARLPVLDSAEKAVEAFVRLMSGGSRA